MTEGMVVGNPQTAQPRPPWALLAAVTVAVGLTFHEYLAWMVSQWWRDEYYSHGFLIPIISGYLIWHQRERLAALPRRGSWWGLPVLVAGLLLHLVALRVGAHFPSGFALIAVLFGLILWLGGWPLGRALLFPVAFLVFMVPLARLLVDYLALPMQLFSARGGGALARALGLPDVVVQGTTITTRDYTFEVAIPCSGLKSVIAMSALGALMAYLLQGPRWKRGLLFVASFPVAVVANLLRIFVTIVLGNSVGPALAEGFFHKASGALVFVFAFAGLLLLGGALGCRKMREDI